MDSTFGAWPYLKRRRRTRRDASADARRLFLQPLEPRLLLDATVVFNEIMYSPAGATDDALEWVELYNQMSVNTDVSGWRLEGGIDFTFPEGTVVPGRGYVVVAIDPAALSAATGLDDALGPFTGRLDNDGEELRLVNRNSRLLSVIDFDDNDPWPVGADGSGFSLAKIDPNSASTPGENWTVSAQMHGTAGAENFTPSSGPSSVPFTDLLVSEGDTASVLVPGSSNLALTWTQPTFNDSAWTQGPTGIGFGSGGIGGGDAGGGETSIRFVGVDATTNDRWRTTDHAKPAGLDADGDDVYGTAGYMVVVGGQVNPPFATVARFPSGLESGAFQSSFDDPARTGPAPVPNVSAGDYWFNGNGGEQNFFTITMLQDASFRLGVVGDTSVDTGGAPMVLYENARSVRVRETVGGGADSGLIDVLGPGESFRNGDVDYYFFDIVDAKAGVQFIVSGLDDTRWAANSLGGLTFDALPGGVGNRVATDIKPLMHGTNATAYVRNEFQLTDTSDIQSLQFDISYNDGFVAYLNGNEIARDNAPASLTYQSQATAATDTVVARETIDISDHIVDLRIGDNVLAVHGLNASPADDNFLVLPELTAVRVPFTELAAQLMINEVASADATEFWFELLNDGDVPVALNGFVIETSGKPYALPAEMLAPGAFRVVTQAEMGFRAADDDVLFLYAPGKSKLLDARRVTGRLRGRSAEHGHRWLYPDAATPSGPNSFAFQNDIVINEILYHAGPSPGDSTEWIELYNRGASAVDLTGWTLRDAVRFDFSPGTILEAGEFLVVSGDAQAMAGRHPDIDIVGDFDRVLSNSNDNILLLDARRNPADEVHYYDDGRWSSWADGGGSSLELRDPRADNSRAEAWAASDESGKSDWNTYTFRRTAASDTGPVGVWNEFVLGMLREGELLIDDVSVIANPDGARTQLIQNGTFEADTVGGSPDKWRIIGNHHGTVIVDPDDPANRVLELAASGPTHHEHNNAGTTFVGNARVVNGREYEISFRAKWLRGSNQLLSRFYVNRVALTTLIDVPQHGGTPGARNSAFMPNAGPTFSDFQHTPIVPDPGQEVVVSVSAKDPDGVGNVDLWWSVDGGSFSRTPMTLGGDRYRGIIPGRAAGTVVQFYVSGRDAAGAVATFPARGADSRAMFEVQDGRGTGNPIDNIRIIMRTSESDAFRDATNAMSNQFVGATVVVNDEEVFYDVGVHPKGASRGRLDPTYWGSYTIQFHPDRLFRGVHERIGLDASGFGGQVSSGGQDEIVIDHIINHAGGEVSLDTDLAYLAAPFTAHNGTVIVELSRFQDDDDFPGGDLGTVFEYELIYYPTTTVDGNRESLKRIQPNGVIGTPIRNLGNDKERYRWNFVIKNNRQADDFSAIIDMAQTFSRSGATFLDSIDRVIDVDQWLRMNALGNLTGVSDGYFDGSLPHNVGLYVRPDDNRVLLLPWDLDGSFRVSTSANIVLNGDLRKLMASPQYARSYYGHLHDIINTTFNAEYIGDWVNHFGGLVNQNFSGITAYIQARANSVNAQILSRVPRISFAVTTNGGNPDITGEKTYQVSGDGWIDVREIRLAGSQSALDVTWTDTNSWTITLPVAFGPNTLAFEAYDFEGKLTGSDSILVTSTAEDLRVADVLRLSEVMYNPADPAAGSMFGNDQFEFIELVNTSDETIDLRGAEFTRGVTFSFTGSKVESLDGGERVVVVRNLEAFGERYADTIDQIKIAGVYIGKLANGGEGLALVDLLGQAAFDFSYKDGWYDITDGDGFSLTVRDTDADPASLAEKSAWQPSSRVNGTPGSDDPRPALGSIVINEILTHTDNAGGDWIELFNTTGETIDLGGWYLSDSGGNPRKFRIPDGTMIPGGGYITFDQFGNGGFGVDSLLENPLGNPGAFGLSELGDALRLTSVDPTRIRENIDAAHVIDESRIILSTATSAVLGTNALSFRNGDLVQYDAATGIASLVFSENVFVDPTGLFPSGENIDAVSLLSDGDLVLSTTGTARIGAISFRDGDLVRFNPTTLVATLLLSEDLFTGGGDIDAVHVVEVGGQIERYVISTNGPVTIDGVLYDDGDLIEIVPGTTSDLAAGLLGNAGVRRFLAESLFAVGSNSSGDPSENIDAVSLGPGGSVVLSTFSGAAFAGRLDEAFQNGDLVRLTPGEGSDLGGGVIGINARIELRFEEDPDAGTTFYGAAAGYREKVDFAGAEREVTFGLYTKSDGLRDFVALVNPTKGQPNGDPRVGPIVFNEVMYNPSPDGDSGGLEFIELLNISDSPVDLFDPANPQNAWAFTAGIGFTFPEGDEGVTLPAGGLALVVPVDEATFRAAHSVPSGVRVLGPYTGVLNNGGEKIELSRPGEPEAGPDGIVPMIEVVRLVYDDVDPWPTKADGEGWSLQLKQPEEYGNDPNNWGITIPGGTVGDFVVAPRVSSVLVWGSGWSRQMLDRLASDGLGSGGASIPGGPGQLETVAWSGVDRLSIRFTEDVIVESGHLALFGVNIAEYDLDGFSYDQPSRTATWSLRQPLRADKLRLVLSNEVKDLSGLPLDGNWTDGADTFPSGNDAVDSDDDFRFRFNVLAGDALPGDIGTGSSVDRRDLIEVIHHLGGSASGVQYDPRMDINADGLIDTADLRAALLRHGTALPTGEPSASSGGAPTIAADVVFDRLGAAPAPQPAARAAPGASLQGSSEESTSRSRVPFVSSVVDSTDRQLARHRGASGRRASTAAVDAALTVEPSTLRQRITSRRRGRQDG